MIKRLGFLFWPLAAIITLLLRAAASSFPNVTEHLYSRGIFVAIRYIWDYTLGLLPVALFYVLILFLLVGFIRFWVKKKKGFVAVLKGLTAFLGFAIFSFFFLWGFNYARIPLPQQIGIKALPAAGDSLSAWLDRETVLLLASREKLSYSTTDSIPPGAIPSDMVDQLRTSLEQGMHQWEIPAAGRVRAHAIAPKGWLIGFGASGIYLPWTGQGQYDASLSHIERPVTTAHEMGHALGFTDEGVCNFLGYYTCINSEDATLQYLGQLAVWRAIGRSAYAFDTKLYHEAYGQLPAGIRADLAAIRRRQKAYRPWFPNFSSAVYDRYLKQQGVKGGMASYGRGILLWEAYKLFEAD
ncbi:MAG: DUF3810 family protein [Bacteroidia bacterium]